MMKALPLLVTSFLLIVLSACGGGEKKSDTSTDSTSAGTTQTVSAELGSEQPIDVGVTVKADEGMDLRLRFRKGETFGYRLKTVEHVVMAQDTVKEFNHQVTIYDYRFKVLETSPEGGAKLRATCLKVQFDGEYKNPAGKNTIHYSSDEKNDHSVEKKFAQYNAPVNAPFDMVVESDGRIAEVTNVDEVIKRFLLDDYGKTRKESRDLITKDYSEMALKQVLQIAFQKVPEHSIGVDSTWSISQPSKIGFLSVRNDATYTLAKVTEKDGERLAHVKAIMVSSYTGNRKVDTGQGIATMDTFNVKGQGTSLLNLDKGRPMRRFIRSDVFVKMFIEPPEELKKLAPEQAKDFWWSQDAYIENTITELEG